MASIGPITIMTRIGEPGAPLSLMVGQLAYNQQNIGTPTIPGDVLYVGDGQNVNVLVGRSRQVELWGDQLISGQKTIDITNLKVTGGEANWLIQTDGQGNLTFTNAPGGGLTQVATDGVTLAGLGTNTSPLSVVAETVAVAVDEVTVTGDGTTAHPLSAVAHSVAVATDNTTLSGNGTTAAPLAVVADSVAVAVTAPSLTGNGTTASPLAVVANSVPVATNATLSGNGTSANPLGVVANTVAVATNSTLTGNGTTGSPLGVVANTVAVATDGLTITGNGTTASPLQAVNGSVAIATDGVTLGGSGVTASPLHVLPNTVPVATNSSLIGNGTTASPLGLNAPVSLQNGGTGVSTSSNAALLTALGAASASSLANYLPLAGGTMIGLIVLSGNATANLNPVPLQQLNSTLTAYAPLNNPTFTGTVTIPSGAQISGYAPLASPTFTGGPSAPNPPANDNSQRLATTSWVDTAISGIAIPAIPVTIAQGGTSATSATAALANLGAAPIASPSFTGSVTLPGNAASNLQAVPLQQLNSTVAGYLPLSGGTLTGALGGTSLTMSGGGSFAGGISASSPSFLQSTTFSLASGQTLAAQFNGNVSIGAPLGQLTVAGTSTFSGTITASNGLIGNNVQATSNFICGNTVIGSGGINYVGGGTPLYGLGGTATAINLLINGASSWIVSGSPGGYQAATQLGFAGNFAYGVIFNASNIYSFTVAASDRRLKSNIIDAGDGLAVVNAIAVHEVDYRVPAADSGQHWRYSLITDEVSPHLPDAVIPAPTEPDIEGYESLDPQRLIACLWRAVQQLSAEVEALKAGRGFGLYRAGEV